MSIAYFQTWAISQAHNTITEEVARSLEGRILHTSSSHSNDSPILSPKEPMGVHSDNYTLHKEDDIQTFLDIHVVHEVRVGIDIWRPKMSVSSWKSWGMCHFRSSENQVLN